MKKLPILLTAAAVAFSLPAGAQKAAEGQTNANSAPAAGVRQSAKDALLTAKVKTALARDVGLKTVTINVDSNGDTVTLKGVVDSEEAKRQAEEVAKQVEGVASVDNQLVVRVRG